MIRMKKWICFQTKAFLIFAASLALSMLYYLPLNAAEKEFTVKQDGSGDFSSLADAVAAVPSDSTLIIYEGIYAEAVNITDKTLFLKGVDRDKCILQCDGSNYFYPSLSIAAGRVSNLTLYSSADKNGDWLGKPPTDINPDIPASAYTAYTVHIEQDYLAGRELQFDNCLFVSDKNHCIGLGMRKHCAVAFINCEFRSYGVGGTIFVHDSPDAAYAGTSSLYFIDCTIYNYKGVYFFNTQSYNPSNRVNLTFQNVFVHTIGYGSPYAYLSDNCYSGETISKLISLDSDDLLAEHGYRQNDLIFCLNEEESSKYIVDTLANISSLEHIIPLSEGITIFLTNGMPLDTFPVYIRNEENEPGGGWCGSASFFLTPDSSGNTFAQMNFNQANAPQE